MQTEFQPLLEEIATLLPAHFGDHFVAGYLHGSVLYGDAIPGVSDLDYMVVLTCLRDGDSDWLQAFSRSLEKRYAAAEVHLTPVTPEELRTQPFIRFALTHNAALHIGTDILHRLAAVGATVPVPDAAFAKSRLAFARHCFQQALNGETPDCTGPLPEADCWVLRKFARYFCIIEGAYFLMCRGRFRSFRATEVLSDLCQELPHHVGVLFLTQIIIEDSTTHDLLPCEYLRKLEPLIEEIFSSIENA